MALGARRAGTRHFYPALAAMVRPVQNIFSSPYTIFIYVSPSPRNLAGSRAGPPISDCVSRTGHRICVYRGEEELSISTLEKKERFKILSGRRG